MRDCGRRVTAPEHVSEGDRRIAQNGRWFVERPSGADYANNNANRALPMFDASWRNCSSIR